MQATEDQIRAALAARAAGAGRTVSRLGYFCAPFRPAEGPLADRVVKAYRPLRDRSFLMRLAEAHAAYVGLLEKTGVPLPRTEFHLVAEGSALRPVIVQEALPEETLMRQLIEAADPEGAVALMEAAGEVIARFWHGVEGIERRVGFHPSIRNFAIVDGQAVFLDTFPPLIGFDREEMGRILVRFSDSAALRLAAPFARRRIVAIQDEWYSAAETLVGLVGSACRLRPDDAETFLAWGRDFAGRRMAPWREEIERGLDRPPRLPGYWIAVRTLLGLEGRPNVNRGNGK